MTGSFHGPGGRFEVELVLNLFVIFSTANIKRKKDREGEHLELHDHEESVLASLMHPYLCKLWSLGILISGLSIFYMIGILIPRLLGLNLHQLS
jgi:hypothetical protein